MPIKKAAKKFIKSSKKKNLLNKSYKNKIKQAVSETREFIDQKKPKKAVESFKKAQKAIDKAKQKKVIKKNTAKRKKNRLYEAIKKIGK
ncbi:MAG: 30S ribosomal protein S20 [Candidatus Moranbacteria bacterium]|nr:30S ribosomal protein S20 [Candidatus Moranbacteria bacterium]